MAKVLHVIPSLGRGGAERQLATLVCNTTAEFEHVVCCLTGPNAFADEIRRHGHSVIELGLSRRLLALRAVAPVAGLLRRLQPDIVQTWLYDACLATRLAQVVSPGVITVRPLQDLIYEHETVRVMGWTPWKVSVRKYVDRMTAAWAHPIVITPSLAWQRAAEEHLAVRPGLLRTIYNSVDRRAFDVGETDAEALRSSLEVPTRATLFINVGRLNPQKGQITLLRAFAQVARQTADAYLVILGVGQLQAALERLAVDLGIASRVRLVGVQSDVGAFFRAADVFVFPSVFEGLGLALVEAMASGLPCIASRLPALEEVIASPEEGILVPPSDPEELAGAMLRLHFDPRLRDALATVGRRAARSRFDVSNTVPLWEQLYRELLLKEAARAAGPSPRSVGTQ